VRRIPINALGSDSWQHIASRHTCGMAALMEPTMRVHASFLQALHEYRAEGRYGHLDPERLEPETTFRRYLDKLRADADPCTHREDGLVPQTTLWLVDGQEYLGRLSIRHALTDQLRIEGGHIGYEIRPTQRRRGYATVVLGMSLPIANELGIDPALLTCDTTNIASRRVIESNGGCLADTGGGVARFWVPTSWSS
jgi:predicted acetyltransferase